MAISSTSSKPHSAPRSVWGDLRLSARLALATGFQELADTNHPPRLEFFYAPEKGELLKTGTRFSWLFALGVRLFSTAILLPFVIFDTVRVFPSLGVISATAVALRLVVALLVTYLCWRPLKILHPIRIPSFAAWRDLLFFGVTGVLLSELCEFLGWSLSSTQGERFLWGTLALSAVAWIVWVDRGGTEWLRKSALVRGLDLVLFNVAFCLIVMEALLALVALYYPNPLLWDERSIVSGIEAHRKRQTAFGRMNNSQGYKDDEFFPGGESDLSIALLGDSFAYSIVPYSRTFATVAERKLQDRLGDRFSRIGIHNLGVPSIGMPHYHYLLLNEVPALKAEIIVLALFIGNDIHEEYAFPIRDWKVVTLWRRFQRIRTGIADLTATQSFETSDAGIEKLPDYLNDPGLEKPTFERQRFLRIERDRVEITNPALRRTRLAYERFFAWFARIHQEAGRDLVVLLIPDEFQVNDDLWQELMNSVADPDRFERDSPQQRILEHTQRLAIPTLDLLPVLRQQPGPLYHLHDTHLNSAGNRVAGEALAEFLLEVLSSRQSAGR